MCSMYILPATVGHFVCKIADTQLVYDFSALNRGPNPVHVIFSFFFNLPLYARVGNLQPFACIHKSWTVLICNVVLGLMVECWSISSVDGAYKLTHTHTHTWRYTYRQVRVRRVLSLFKDVSLRTRRALSLYKVYGDSALLVFNGTWLNNDGALLTLNWQYMLKPITTCMHMYIYTVIASHMHIIATSLCTLSNIFSNVFIFNVHNLPTLPKCT